MSLKKKPPLEMRLRVLCAVDYAPGTTTRERIKSVSERIFVDHHTGASYRFTWRTISTWLYRFKKRGLTSLDNKTRADKNGYRKVQVNELAEAIHEILPHLRPNKSGLVPKSVLYRQLLQHRFFTRTQLAPTTFYRMIRDHGLLQGENAEKLRRSFAMQFANELWQADTMHGPSIQQADGAWRKTFLIAFLDDASRLITHAQFFYRDDTANMIEAFRTALFKRGRPERLYFDNGSNYTSKEILQACLRLDIHLSHAPIRDGAAKGKIERFFRGFRDRFLTLYPEFTSLEDLNDKTCAWIENEYNTQHHAGIQMVPIDRFTLDHARLRFLTDDEYAEEIFYVEVARKVSKTNVFSIDSRRFECPVDLRLKTIAVRYDRTRRHRFLVYYADRRMGEATALNLHHNAHRGEPA